MRLESNQINQEANNATRKQPTQPEIKRSNQHATRTIITQPKHADNNESNQSNQGNHKEIKAAIRTTTRAIRKQTECHQRNHKATRAIQKQPTQPEIIQKALRKQSNSN